MHSNDSIDTDSGDALKPDIITFYNSTKSGVDTVDELKENYSMARISNRWSLRVFFFFH